MKSNGKAVLIDVREDSEWAAGHAKGATHLGIGVLERDLEIKIPDCATQIVMYCGGGARSALACEAALKLGYKNVLSLTGGSKAMANSGWEMINSSDSLRPCYDL